MVTHLHPSLFFSIHKKTTFNSQKKGNGKYRNEFTAPIFGFTHQL